MLTTLAIGMPGPVEWIIIAAIALLLFGKRLPEVGKSLGQGIVEFKKGLKGIDADVAQVDAQPRAKLDQPVARFDPFTGKPVAQESDGSTRQG